MSQTTTESNGTRRLDLREKKVEGLPDAEQFREFLEHCSQACTTSLVPFLPSLFSLEGKPYTLQDHFPFEPIFDFYLPPRRIFKSARQVAKTTSAACSIVAQSIARSYFKTLVVTPLSETVKRFSSNYVKPFIEGSPLRDRIVDQHSHRRVLQRSYRNGSINFFQYAFRDCDRIRGISSHYNVFDEIQDLDYDFIPIINETMSGSPFGGTLELYNGTPKTRENTIEMLWGDSSQGEWLLPCPRCHYDNIPSLACDLDGMIGPYREDISAASPGLICRRCRRPIDPRGGMWYHGRPELRNEFPGYHIPQIIMPMHCFNPDKWLLLTSKQAGGYEFTPAKFYNEVCGESYDSGARLVTLDDLKNACLLGHDNEFRQALAKSNNYRLKLLAVDWGGGGLKGTSWTVMTVLGWNSGHTVDVLFSLKSLTPHDRDGEAQTCLDMLKIFKADYLVHDFAGTGSYREQYVINAGFPLDRIIPINYVGPTSKAIMKYQKPLESGQRGYYQVDKARSLALTCQLIKHRQIRFFNYDFVSSSQRGLLQDFLALVEDKVDSRAGRDIYRILRNPQLSDDFAQTVNFGICGVFHLTRNWPNVAETTRYAVTAAEEDWFTAG